MNQYKTLQEDFWAGNFGDEYANRNKGSQLVASNISLFSKILSSTRELRSVIEFGANIGLNLYAIKKLFPEVELSAVEINQKAVDQLKRLGEVKIYHQSLLEFSLDYPRDLAFTKGVLIHIDPDRLYNTYDLLYRSSNKYICIAEYYNPTPVSLPYRGHENKLFKRDFAGEMLTKYHDLQLIDYGFTYHKDTNHPQDDLTWFLLEKLPQQSRGGV